MIPKWIVENFNADPEYQRIIDAVKNQGMECIEVKYIPFLGGFYDFIPNSSEECVVFYGSLNLGRQLQREKNWVPGVWCTLENFKCSTHYPKYHKYLINHDHIFLPTGVLKGMAHKIYDMLSVNNTIFIRPDSGYKEFSGQIVSKYNFDAFVDSEVFGYGDMPDNGFVVISSPKEITNEWRFFVGRDAVISGCTCKKDNVIHFSETVDDQAAALAHEISQMDWTPDEMFVIDICKSGDEYRLMEINSFSCSGIYKCDAEKIVEYASKMAIRECQEYNERNTE